MPGGIFQSQVFPLHLLHPIPQYCNLGDLDWSGDSGILWLFFWCVSWRLICWAVLRTVDGKHVAKHLSGMIIQDALKDLVVSQFRTDQRSWYYAGTPKMSCLQFEAFKSRDAQRFAHCLPSFPPCQPSTYIRLCIPASSSCPWQTWDDACNLVKSDLVCSPSDLLGCKSDKWILGCWKHTASAILRYLIIRVWNPTINIL